MMPAYHANGPTAADAARWAFQAGKRPHPAVHGRRAAARSMAGVTLVELLVTLAIATILLSVAIPSFQEAIAVNRAAGLTNELTAALNLARSEAVTRGATVTVCRSDDLDTAIDNTADPTTGPSCSVDAATGWQGGWLVFVNPNEDGTVDDDEIRLKVGQPAVSDAVIDGGGDADDTTDGNFDKYVSYRPSGVSRGSVGGNANGTLAICSPPGKRRNIVISSTGRIRIEQPADAACP